MGATEETGTPVTIYTVARHAGVSIATVSRVLQGSCPVSPETRRKVLRAVQELDYVPLRVTRRPGAHLHETHGLLLPGLAGPYYSELLAGYESTAAQYGQSVAVMFDGGPVELDVVLRRAITRLDGLVVATGSMDDEAISRLCRTVPTVLVARDAVPGCDTVTVENVAAAATLTRHLLAHGVDRLVFVGHPAASYDISERYRGFREALEGRPEALPPILVAYEERSAPAVVATLLSARDAVNGLVCANDELALSTIRLLARHGIKVPDDMAVVGFDDLAASSYIAPGLTTVRQPMRELGRWAAIRLHERIGGRDHDVTPQVLPTQLIRRASCGCADDYASPGR